MGDMLFEQFLKDLIDNDIQELTHIVNYRGIAGLLHEFETWIAHEGWLCNEDENADDEEDEHEETLEKVANAAVESARIDVEGIVASNSWIMGANFALDKVKEKIKQ